MPIPNDNLQHEISAIMQKETVARQKISQMHTEMHLFKNQIRLEEELRECDRRLSFLASLQDATNVDDVIPGGITAWTSLKLNLSVIKLKIRELSWLFVREEKLRGAYGKAIASRELGVEGALLENRVEESVARMGLIKEIVDKYTTLLPSSELDLGDWAGEGDSADGVRVRRSKGRTATVQFKICNISVDRFDDMDLRLELYANNELVVSSEKDEIETCLENYNSHSGAKLEIYVWDCRSSKALAMAVFNIVSVIGVDAAKVYLEPRGHLDMSIAFKIKSANDYNKNQLRRADAITKTRALAARCIVAQRHRLKPGTSFLPTKCAHCHSLCLAYLKCLDCGFLCHRSASCSAHIVTECLPNSTMTKGGACTLATFNVPHGFTDLKVCMQSEWCMHCGKWLMLVKGSCQCRECGRWAHSKCAIYIPAHCGLTRRLKRVLPLTTSLEKMPSGSDILSDYEFLQTIGRGSFGKVVVARSLKEDRLVAIKMLKKGDIVKHGEVENVRTEFRVLNMIKRYQDPFCIGLLDVFQSGDRVYFVSEFVGGGDLMFHIQSRPFTKYQVKYANVAKLLTV